MMVIFNDVKNKKEVIDKLINDDNSQNNIKHKWAKIIAFFSIVAIAFGGLNDTIDAVDKIYNITLSQFTDIPSHNKLSKIYVRAPEELLDDTFGAPSYIKKTTSGDFIKYYKDKRFILSSVTRDGAIVAFLVFPKNNFIPNTSEHAGGDNLLFTPFSSKESVTDIRVNASRSVSYYIEENPVGEFSNLYSSIAGYSEFLMPLDQEKQKLFYRLSEALVIGDNVSELVVNLRNKVIPNFYGYSIERLNDLESAILTLTEYRLMMK
ncbi:ETEC_3214 domain-containing protein [Photobacterium kishitanii]|uniref:ETEC_3214 domain-containing protein n=1 Tax=Photobacterium kishitanii TaxID=318456 RepID=UPI003B975ED5